MKCKFCGKEIEDGSTFCGYCGQKQTQIKYCIKCGHEIGLDDKWCWYCGADQGILSNKQEADEKPVHNEESTSTEPVKQEERAKSPVVADNAQTNISNSQEDNSYDSEYLEKPESSNRKYLIIGVVAIIIVIACVVGYFTFGSRANSQVSEIDSVAVDTTAVDTVATEPIQEEPDESEFDISPYTEVMKFTDKGISVFHLGMTMEQCSQIANDKVPDAHLHPCGYRYTDEAKGGEYSVDVTGGMDEDGNLTAPNEKVEGISATLTLSEYNSDDTQSAFKSFKSYFSQKFKGLQVTTDTDEDYAFKLKNGHTLNMHIYDTSIMFDFE